MAGYDGVVGQRRHHYEQAFEAYLRDRRVPYVSVHDAKKAILPETGAARLALTHADGRADETLKSFDFVIYGDARNLLVEIKGRKIMRRASVGKRSSSGRLECWVTQDDVSSLQTWEGLFGAGFEATFVFVYWCDEAPPEPLFEDIFEYRGLWYAVRTVDVASYAQAMKPRSARWRTVHVPAGLFDRISGPLLGRAGALAGHSFLKGVEAIP